MSDYLPFVDATLTSIHFGYPEKSLVLLFKTGNGLRRIRLTAEGVVDFVGEEFRYANIVDFVNHYCGNEPSDDVLSEGLKFAFHGNESDMIPPLLDKHMAMVRSKELTLFEIVPVFGATISILARAISIDIEPAE